MLCEIGEYNVFSALQKLDLLEICQICRVFGHKKIANIVTKLCLCRIRIALLKLVTMGFKFMGERRYSEKRLKSL